MCAFVGILLKLQNAPCNDKDKGQSLPTALGTRWREYSEWNSDDNTAKHARITEQAQIKE